LISLQRACKAPEKKKRERGRKKNKEDERGEIFNKEPQSEIIYDAKSDV
jgi:hypothetical protein